MTTDYTNPRWHVEGPNVTHEDIPGMIWVIHDRTYGEHWASRDGNVWVLAHAARAWLAAQPKPTIKKGMRIEATLRGGAVLTGEVTRVTDYSNWAVVQIGGGVTCYADVKHYADDAMDITAWHEVTA